MDHLTIVIVTYNSASVIGRLLEQISSYGANIHLVDNGSTDETIAIARAYPNIKVIQGQNIGYGRGANLGFKEIKTPYALLINPDVMISHDTLNKLLSFAQKYPDVGIWGANMFHYDIAGHKEYAKNYVFGEDHIAYVNWVVGALMLIKTDALARVGMFDENIFLFFEETDLCKRFINAGYKLAVAETVEVEHYPGTSSPQSVNVLRIKAWHSAWSRSYYYHKHFSRGKYFIKCFSKIMSCSTRSIKAFITLDKRGAIKNYYELLGVIAHILGVTAFKNGVGKLA